MRYMICCLLLASSILVKALEFFVLCSVIPNIPGPAQLARLVVVQYYIPQWDGIGTPSIYKYFEIQQSIGL
jgi:hypothetical protein